METDLPGDGRFVLTERSGNSGLGRIVANTDLDDPSFIEGDVKMLIRRSHKRYLRSKRGIQVWTKIMIRAGRVNATCSSWRLNAISAHLELRLLFHFSITGKFEKNTCQKRNSLVLYTGTEVIRLGEMMRP